MENNEKRGRRPRIARKSNGEREQRRSNSYRNSRNFDSDRENRGFNRKEDGDRDKRRSYNSQDRDFNNEDRGERRERRSYSNDRGGYRGEDRGFSHEDRGERRERRPYNREDRGFNSEDRGERRERRSYSNDRGGYNSGDREDRGDRRSRSNSREGGFNRRDKDYSRQDRGYSRDNNHTDRRSYDDRTRNRNGYERRNSKRMSFEKGNSEGYEAPMRTNEDGLIRLNKYISNSGICSRREADDLIKAGAVTVNGQVVTEMGHKVKPEDVIVYGGERLSSERKKYLLLNKPKGYITTLDDPQKRNTVLTLIEDACRERLYPVGRLDRNTTGLLLFTNDGDLTKKLTHPSTGVYKVYQVELDRPLEQADMRKMLDGIDLEDGSIAVDDVQYANDGDNQCIVGVQLHSGRNRIVRRIFEYLGYSVEKLDRTVFAGLTKKDLPRGHYRELTQREISFLKMV